jgi:DNA polymerase IV
MAELLRQAQPFSPLVEAEEASGHLFMDLTGTKRLWGPPQDVAWRIRRAVRKELGLDPIWGLAANKLMAKVATRVVKPDGEHMVEPGQEMEFLLPLPLYLLPGLERADLLLLREYHLQKVGQALPWRLEQLAVLFGPRAGQVHAILRGQDESPVLPLGQRPPVVRLEQEFASDTNSVEQLETTLRYLTQRAGAALRGQGRVARRLILSLDYSDGQRVVRQRSLAPGTANDFILLDLARAALASAWTRRVRVRFLRLVCDRLAFPLAQMELPLLADEQSPQRQERLLAALDHIRARHGLDKIQLGRGPEA